MKTHYLKNPRKNKVAPCGATVTPVMVATSIVKSITCKVCIEKFRQSSASPIDFEWSIGGDFNREGKRRPRVEK